MRREYRWGPARIGHQLGLASSTVHRIITAAGLGRFDQGDRATAGPPQRVGWRYVHTAIDDRTRLGYSEIHTNETARTAVGFLQRALRRFNRAGVRAERVLTDNGPCYRSKLWKLTCYQLGVCPKYTRRFRSQTNGKVERFHRTLIEEWAYVRPWMSETQRCEAFDHFIHHYNYHRPTERSTGPHPSKHYKPSLGTTYPGCTPS